MSRVLIVILLLSSTLVIMKVIQKISQSRVKRSTRINEWMNMSYKDRLQEDEEHKKKVAKRKRLLLNKIRREYREMSKKK